MINRNDSTDVDRASLQASLSIDRVCDEFENAWKAGQSPEIAEYLGKVEFPSRGALIQQLVTLELDLSQPTKSLGDYLIRFPDYAVEIENVFEELDLFDWVGKSLGAFQIQRELGRGGMGVVFLANDVRLERRVAIKLLNSARRSDSKWLRRFWREARTASGLNHPNLMTIYELGDEDGTPFIACEYVDGETLRDCIEKRRLPYHVVIDYCTQIAEGMAVAHEAGIIHRDLKADNIMIRKDGILKILDFGLARNTSTVTSLVTKSGAIAGTVHFMSPEQTRGKNLTTATDVFSFGVLLYLMLTGKLPFQGETNSDVIVSILQNDPVPVSECEISVPHVLDNLVMRCLEKDALSRPSFVEVADILRLLTRGERSYPAEGSLQNLVGEDVFETNSKQGSTYEMGLTVLAHSEDILHPSSIRYAQSGDVNIAWQEIGSGPTDIVFVMGWVSHLDWFWKEPSFASFLRRLASFARVILFDKRGTGLSDKVPLNHLPDLETRMDDVRAVMEAANSERAVLCGVSEGGPLCALFAATYPEKTIALTMLGSYSRRLWAEDYPWGPTAEKREVFLKEIAENWGGPLGLDERAPSMKNDARFREWWSSYLRMGASPGAAVALTKMNAQIDIRAILPSIQIPSLIIHRTGDRCLLAEEGRYLSERIPGAKYVELPGEDHLPFVGDAEAILDEIEMFLTGLKRGAKTDCVLATVLCVRCYGSESDEVGEKFKKIVGHEVTLFRGKNYLMQGETLVATFDGPVRSILCAQAILRLATRLGVKIRCGLDTGTCNIGPSEIHGPAVDGAHQVSTLADSGTILATATLRNLISGEELAFEPFDKGAQKDLFQVTKAY